MSARRAALAALLAAVAVDCSVGPNPNTYGPARDPAGTTCTLAVNRLGQQLIGELLAVRSADAVMVVNHKVWAIPYRLIQSSDCEHAGAIPFDTTGVLVSDWADNVRLRARYPQGINDDLMAHLLQAYGQTVPMRPENQ